jgi:hypothetical protein
MKTEVVAGTRTRLTSLTTSLGFFIPGRHEFGMTKTISLCPFQELNYGYQFGPNPQAFLHPLRVQDFSPSGTSSLRQIHERENLRFSILCYHSSPQPIFVEQLTGLPQR